MIDFHSHIIPEIDDGARELKESLEMLEEASSAGFDGCCIYITLYGKLL